MTNKFALIGVDTETTGLDRNRHDPIEISLHRLSTDDIKTWCLRPMNPDNIEPEALHKNGHKREDILHATAAGRERYREPSIVLAEIENWLAIDGLPSSNRVLLGHNVHFDREMLASLWRKCGCYDTLPWNDKYGIDTMQIEFVMDYILGSFGEGYSLHNLSKKYKVKQERAHTAEDDTKVMSAIFRQQIKRIKIDDENTVRSS